MASPSGVSGENGGKTVCSVTVSSDPSSPPPRDATTTTSIAIPTVAAIPAAISMSRLLTSGRCGSRPERCRRLRSERLCIVLRLDGGCGASLPDREGHSATFGLYSSRYVRTFLAGAFGRSFYTFAPGGCNGSPRWRAAGHPVTETPPPFARAQIAKVD
jgi:hypothetical protein